MNKTANYQLNQWDAEDKVQRTDFNADNAKIDAAIAKCGNCRVRVSTYVGDGALTRTHIFERKPILVMIHGGSSTVFIYPDDTAQAMAGWDNTMLKAIWEECSVTVENHANSAPSDLCNVKNMSYYMLIFVFCDAISEQQIYFPGINEKSHPAPWMTFPDEYPLTHRS